MRRIPIAVALFLSALYFGDYLHLRFRHEQFGSVQVKRYYAIPQKNNRVQFMFDQPETQTCVRSLFPHLGCVPCWYLKRNNIKRIDE